jgi:hypothetical protein
MKYKVFIGYSSEDNDKAQYIYNCLGRIVQFVPYKAELYKAYGEDFKQRIQNELYESHFMVVLLTENGKNSQWVNQEIGFAYALKRRTERKHKELPLIIPLSHKGVQLKGFITKDTTDFLVIDKFTSLEDVVANIILAIRRYIPRGLEEGVLKLRITCSNCVDKKGFPSEYESLIPDSETIRKAMELGQPVFESECTKCHVKNSFDARTFLPIQRS